MAAQDEGFRLTPWLNLGTGKRLGGGGDWRRKMRDFA
jgi:hypothetical protein